MLFLTMLVLQGEELNIQHFVFCISCMILLGTTIFIAYFRKYELDIVDIVMFLAYLYVSFNEYQLYSYNRTDTYTIQLHFVLYFACRIIFYYLDLKHIIVCSIDILAIFQSLIGTGQLIGVLNSRHTLFPVTGTFLNPGSFGNFLSVIGVIIVLYVYSNYSIFKYRQTKYLYDKETVLFITTYYLSIAALFFIVIMLVLSKSRSALLGFFFPLIIFILNKKSIRQYIIKLRYKKAFLLLGILLLLLFFFELYCVRPESANVRLHIWKVSLCEIDKSAVTGTGLGSFPKQFIIKQERFYEKHGFESKWVKYADTPYYAFNEYLNIVYESGAIGLFFFILIMFLILKKQLSCDHNQIFAFGIISILIISLTSYPLHIIKISIILMVLMSKNEYSWKGLIPYKFSSFFLFLIFVATALKLPYYLSSVNATAKWETMKQLSNVSLIEIRQKSDFEKLYNHLKGNDRFMIDYGVFLKNKRENLKSIEILQLGYAISNNPDFPLLLADINASLGNEYEAEQYYKKAFSMVPNRIIPLYLLAIFYYDTEQYKKFKNLANYIINFNPKIRSEQTDRIKNDISNLLNISHN
jgi:O-antigen polymerase